MSPGTGTNWALDRRSQLVAGPAPLAIGLGPDDKGWRGRWTGLWRSGELQRRTLLALPLLAVALAILAFGGVYGWAYGSAYVLVYGALAGWAVQVWRGKLRVQPRAIYLPMAAFGVFVLASYALGFSVVRASTLTAMLHLGAAGAVFLLVTQLLRPETDQRWLPAALAVFTGVVGFVAILQALTANGAIYWHFRYTFASPAGPFVNRNHFAGCMELLIPAASVEAFRRQQEELWKVAAWAAAPALGVAAVILTASRGGALSLAVEGVAAAGVLLAAQRRAPAGRARGNGLFAGLALSVAVVTMLAVVGNGRLRARLVPNAADDVDLQIRSQLNQSSLAMWKAHRWVGWGLGTWADVYPGFARFDDFRTYEFAHNDYLQWLAETGLAGAACAAAFWGFWLADFRRRVRREGGRAGDRGNSASLAFCLAAAIACLGVLVHSWTDFNLHIPANLLLFFALCGWAVT